MGKLNKRTVRPATGRGPITTAATPTLTTHQGGTGYARDAKSELFLLAVTNMVGEDTFYERAKQRDDRFRALVHEVAVADPAWTLGMVGWLRGEANMRTASIVMAAEAVKARLDALPPGREKGEDGSVTGVNRKLIAAALQRADEPGELLAYWMSAYGRRIPKPVKRGVADAVQRLYTEYNLLKYDTASHAVRFADVVDLVHPSAGTPEQGALYRYALDRRHGRDDYPEGLPMVINNQQFRKAVAMGRTDLLADETELKAAGMTWEDALSLAGSKVDKRKLWEALIPSMGYMALLRNLRNFDEAGVGRDVARAVANRLADPDQVARSRQLPMRFLSAYRAAPNLRWAQPLDDALTESLANIPELPGRTLILIDVSGSMRAGFSKDGTLARWDAAAVFGIALGMRCAQADVWAFDDGVRQFGLTRGGSPLAEVERWKRDGYFRGGGTYTAGAVGRTYQQHDRVVILTDEQSAWGGDPGSKIPANIPLYTANLAGYRAGHGAGGQNRHVFGSLTDQMFRMIPWLERGHDGAWPWETGA